MALSENDYRLIYAFKAGQVWCEFSAAGEQHKSDSKACARRIDWDQGVGVAGAPDSPGPNTARHLLRKPCVRLV